MLCHILDTPLKLGYILVVFHSFLALFQSLIVSIFFSLGGSENNGYHIIAGILESVKYGNFIPARFSCVCEDVEKAFLSGLGFKDHMNR